MLWSRFPGFRSSYSPRLPARTLGSASGFDAAFVPITVAGRREMCAPFPVATMFPEPFRQKKTRTSSIKSGDSVFILDWQGATPDPRGAHHCFLSRSSGFRILLLAAPSHPLGQWHGFGVRPRLRRRVRDGIAPSSLLRPKGRSKRFQCRSGRCRGQGNFPPCVKPRWKCPYFHGGSFRNSFLRAQPEAKPCGDRRAKRFGRSGRPGTHRCRRNPRAL